MNISGFDGCLEVSPEVIFGQTDLLDSPILDENSSLDDGKKEISDAILEVLEEEEASLERRVGERVNFSTEERRMYEALGNEGAGLDYSTLEYGKIAEPLAVKWDSNQYEQEDRQKGQGIRFVSEETLSINDVNKVIEEQAMLHKLGMVTTLVSASTRDMFKYYKLFNHALVKVKYDTAFS